MPATIAAPAAATGTTETVVVPFSAADDTFVTWAVERIDDLGCDTLMVVHPNPRAVGYEELLELRVRFATRFAGVYEVLAGHPDAPYSAWPDAALYFVRSDLVSGG